MVKNNMKIFDFTINTNKSVGEYNVSYTKLPKLF